MTLREGTRRGGGCERDSGRGIDARATVSYDTFLFNWKSAVENLTEHCAHAYVVLFARRAG